MTDEEILDRLRRLTTWLSEEQQEQAADLLDELSDRLSHKTFTMDFAITGSAPILAAAIGKIITDNISASDLERLRNDVIVSLATKLETNS